MRCVPSAASKSTKSSACKLDRRAWWPLVPAAIAFVLVTFVDNRQAASSIDPDSAAAAEKQVKKSVESLRKKIEELQKQAEKDKGLKAANGLFKQIEQGTRELAAEGQRRSHEGGRQAERPGQAARRAPAATGRQGQPQAAVSEHEEPRRRPRRESGPGHEARRLEESLRRSRRSSKSNFAKASSTPRPKRNSPSSSSK